MFKKIFFCNVDFSLVPTGEAVGVDMEGVVNGKEVPTSLVQVADTNRNIFLFRQARLFKEERVRKSPPLFHSLRKV